MSEADLEQTEPTSSGIDLNEQAGLLHVEEKQDTSPPSADREAAPDVPRATPLSSRVLERAGTAEHLAARLSIAELDASTPEIKQQLSELRAEVTRLVTGLRWGGQSVNETAERMVPLLNIGPVPQWRPVLIPSLLEIDRAGNLIPVWLKILEEREPETLSPSVNPGETPIGRARRYAILMLGNYKSTEAANAGKVVGFARPGSAENNTKTPEFIQVLGKLATDPNTSLYAAQALVKQNTTQSIQTLVSALKEAESWAKVDIVEGCLSLHQPRFYDLLVASGLDRVPGLESYVAISIYRIIPLDKYLRGSNGLAPRISQQAALLFSKVMQESMLPPQAGARELPVIFDQDLPSMANALFEGARTAPNWQYALAIHHLAVFLGHYWSEISRGAIQDTRILEPIYACLPMMPDVERWMNGPGRDVLLAALHAVNDEAFVSIVKILGALRDPRATAALLARIEATQILSSREQAYALAAACETLARLYEQRAVTPMLQLVKRRVDVQQRTQLPRRRENLPAGDANIPGSIVYAAVIHACGELGGQDARDSTLQATNDFDPYVRTQAIDTLKRLDPTGDEPRSRMAAREALDDPSEEVVRAACQLILQYRDTGAVPSLQRLVETRRDLASVAYDTLRQLEVTGKI